MRDYSLPKIHTTTTLPITRTRLAFAIDKSSRLRTAIPATASRRPAFRALNMFSPTRRSSRLRLFRRRLSR